MNKTQRRLVALIIELASRQKRVMVAIAGPPGAGKSTLADILMTGINNSTGTDAAVILPMDGFHLDNAVLDQMQARDRKGAPHTFDVAGFIAVLSRVIAANEDVVVPVFDRELDLARAGGRTILQSHSIILVEGNYLLLDQHPWSSLPPMFDYRIYLSVPETLLTQRLVQRWLDHDHSAEDALARAESNDLPNVRLVTSQRLPADTIVDSDNTH